MSQWKYLAVVGYTLLASRRRMFLLRFFFGSRRRNVAEMFIYIFATVSSLQTPVSSLQATKFSISPLRLLVSPHFLQFKRVRWTCDGKRHTYTWTKWSINTKNNINNNMKPKPAERNENNYEPTKPCFAELPPWHLRAPLTARQTYWNSTHAPTVVVEAVQQVCLTNQPKYSGPLHLLQISAER